MNAGTFSQPFARASRRTRRAFAWSVAASVTAHLIVVTLIALPRTLDTPDVPQVLEVVIAEPPRPVPPAVRLPKPAPAPAPKRVEPTKRIETPKPRQEAPAAAPPVEPRPIESKPVLALPAESPAPPVFTVPQAASTEPRNGANEGKAAAAPREGPGGEGVATTPPSFNAAYLKNDPPRYPLLARRNGIEGRVNLRVTVTRDGRAAQVQIHQSSGSEALDNAAIEAVRKWQFVPARRGQEPVEASVIVPIVFKLEKTG